MLSKVNSSFRDNVGESLARAHLIDRKDILNISRAYGLNEIIRHNNDQMSVLSWVKSYEETDNNPVLFYKMQGMQRYFLIK